MSNLVKISGVVLYASASGDQAETTACEELLRLFKIDYSVKNCWTSPTLQRAHLESLTNSVWGPDFEQVTFTRFPVVVWTEHYDDYERYQRYSITSADLEKSSLLKFFAR